MRNYSVMTPIAADRGIPSDASQATIDDLDADSHSASWAGMDELLAVDYEQIVEDRWDAKETEKGELITLREFLGNRFFEALKRLQERRR